MAIKEKKGPEIESDYFWLPKQVLKICGVRIMPGGNILYRVYAGFVLSLFVSLTLEELYSIVVFFRDVDKMANLVSVCFSHIAGKYLASDNWACTICMRSSGMYC